MGAEERGVIRLRPGEGGALRVPGELVTPKVGAGPTGGAYSLFEATSGPGGGPPPHVQHREDECCYVVEGEFEFVVEGDAARAGAGSLVYVPRGTLHSYRNVGAGVGRLLLILSPGGLHERFFGEVGEPAPAEAAGPPAPEGSPDAASIAAVAAQYGIEIPRPGDGKGHEREDTA